jgi:hypothetical protein
MNGRFHPQARKWVVLGRVMMDFEDVKAAVEAAAGERREMTCHEARQLAEDLDVEYTVVGRACNKVGIGMRHCQWAPFCICEPSLNRKGKKRSDDGSGTDQGSGQE